MEALKTILKWALPSSKFAYQMLATSAEIFCRHSFGRRYAPTMLGSFFCCLLFLNLCRSFDAEAHPGLIDTYLLIFFCLLVYHFIGMWRSAQTIHSYSSGRSWGFWSQHNFNPNAVKIFYEPLINFGGGVLLLPANSLLSLWLQLAGICLFIKGCLSYRRNDNRIQDSIDARLEGERIGTGVREQSEPQGGREQSVNTVVAAESVEPPANSIQQIYSRIDPALQQLIATPNQDSPNPVASEHFARPLVVVLRQRQIPSTPPRIVVAPQPKNSPRNG